VKKESALATPIIEDLATGGLAAPENIERRRQPIIPSELSGLNLCKLKEARSRAGAHGLWCQGNRLESADQCGANMSIKKRF